MAVSGSVSMMMGPTPSDAAQLLGGQPPNAPMLLDQPNDMSPMNGGSETEDAAIPLPVDAARPITMDMPSERRYTMPILPADRHLINGTWIIGIDHGPRSNDQTQCTNFDEQGFPFCYNGHEGTDFLVTGGFRTTDMTDVHVIAAAQGTVIRVEDGHYDRCHGELNTGEVSCDGNPIVPNVVHIRHPDGWVTRYLHLKKHSIVVNLGDEVECGQVIGRVGSSGWSSFPHLHFTVIDPRGHVVDPYQGSVTGPRSLWMEQIAEDGLPGAACP